jgi:hypothetical protein
MAAGFLTQSRKVAKSQRVFSILASWRLGAFALKGPFFIRTTVRKNHAIPRRFLPQKNAKNA